MERRNFIRNTGIALAGTTIIPLAARCGRKNPNALINIGMIGTGDHGTGWNLKYYLQYPELCRVVAVCDVGLSRAKKAKKIVDEAYKTTDCKIYQDFRDVLNDKSIDAVQISTPDHWHVPVSVMAALRGKHVCCEKPTLTIKEGRLLCDVISKTGVVYQVSLEDRFVTQYHQMAEITLNGRLGQLKHIDIELPGPGTFPSNIPEENLKITEPPADFDYDLWLGPAPEIPYISARTFFNFRQYYGFSGGTLTDWGAHYCDTAQLVSGYDHSGPVEITPVGETIYFNDGIFNTASNYELLYKYPNNVTMRVKNGGASIRIEGEEGWIESVGWRKPLVASDEKILDLGEKTISLPTGNNEILNFLESIKADRDTIYSPELIHRTSTLLHCGNVALKLNRKVEWDPIKEHFVNDPDAEKTIFYKREMREKWSYSKICPRFNY